MVKIILRPMATLSHILLGSDSIEIEFTPASSTNSNSTSHHIPCAWISEKISTIISKFDNREFSCLEEPILFLYNGDIFSDKDSISINMESYEAPNFTTPLNIYAIPSYLPYGQNSLQLDQSSLRAAIEWMSTVQDLKEESSLITAQLTLALNADQGENIYDSSPEPINQVPADLQPVAHLGPEPIQWFRFGIFARMLMFYFVFCHNRSNEDRRKFVMIGVIFLVYFLQIGAFSYLCSYMLHLLRRNNIEAPIGVPANNRAFNFQRFLVRLEQFSQQGVVIPRDPGIVYDIASFIIAAIASLFPSWDPNFAPVAEQIPARG